MSNQFCNAKDDYWNFKSKGESHREVVEQANFNLRNSVISVESNLNTSNLLRNSVNSRYNEGSVYRQASRFNPYFSSSTNKSSSISGSVEVIISDLEEKIESQSRLELSPLNEMSNENSDDPETVFIQNIIKQKKKRKTENRTENEGLQQIIVQIQKIQEIKKVVKEKNMHKLRMKILQAVHYK